MCACNNAPAVSSIREPQLLQGLLSVLGGVSGVNVSTSVKLALLLTHASGPWLHHILIHTQILGCWL